MKISGVLSFSGFFHFQRYGAEFRCLDIFGAIVAIRIFAAHDIHCPFQTLAMTDFKLVEMMRILLLDLEVANARHTPADGLAGKGVELDADNQFFEQGIG